jgi:hypothetical protein
MLIVFATVTPYGCEAKSSGCAKNASAIGTATLAWETPKKRTDESIYTDVGGYKVYCKRLQDKNYTVLVDLPLKNNPQMCQNESSGKGQVVAAIECSYVMNNLVKGNYHFAVSVYESKGGESALSNDVKVSIK